MNVLGALANNCSGKTFVDKAVLRRTIKSLPSSYSPKSLPIKLPSLRASTGNGRVKSVEFQDLSGKEPLNTISLTFCHRIPEHLNPLDPLGTAEQRGHSVRGSFNYLPSL